MAVPFPKTLRSLRADDGARARMAVGVAVVLLAAWVAWLVLARVRLTAVTEGARIEAGAAAVPIQTEVMGRVVEANVEVGREVLANEVLIRLESAGEDAALAQARRQLAHAEVELAHRRREIAAVAGARRAADREALAVIALSKARRREARARARLATEEARHLEELLRHGHAGALETRRATTEAESREAASDASERDGARHEWAMERGSREREASVARLQAELSAHEGLCASLALAVTRLERDAEHRVVRAPVAGRIVEAMTVSAGSVLAAGAKVASIVAPGPLRIVAEFQPSLVVGHVAPGQRGILRAEGFPWTEYGTVGALVRGVGAEPREGLVRVVLDIDADRSNPRIPLQHGLRGVLEVDVEEVSPFSMLLRAIGGASMPKREEPLRPRLEAQR